MHEYDIDWLMPINKSVVDDTEVSFDNKSNILTNIHYLLNEYKRIKKRIYR